jgi:hypothetical protein
MRKNAKSLAENYADECFSDNHYFNRERERGYFTRDIHSVALAAVRIVEFPVDA